MFKSNLVVTVDTTDGKHVREEDGNIYLPFNSDYFLYFRNLNNTKVKIAVSIDGQDVLSNSCLLIEPNSNLYLRGFLQNNIVKNNFRFIEKTDQIRDYRGDQVMDGIIKVEFWKEMVSTQIQNPQWVTTIASSGYISKNLVGGHSTMSSYPIATNSSMTYGESKTYGEGITVKGQETQQNFVSVYGTNWQSNSEIITLRLRGIKEDGLLVSRPITTREKLTCPTCGDKWGYNIKYCGTCGTFIER